jgi:hypothetical protein
MPQTTKTYRIDAGGSDGLDGAKRIRWGAIFGGGVLALALLALLSTLWFALSYGSEVTVVRDNLAWYIGISAVGCLFIGALLAGRVSGVPGAGTGVVHGLVIWALLLIAIVSIGAPSVLNLFNVGRIADGVGTNGSLVAQGVDGALWASFWSILLAFGAAGVGGGLGGAMTPSRRASYRNTVVDDRIEPLYEEEDELPVAPERESRAS